MPPKTRNITSETGVCQLITIISARQSADTHNIRHVHRGNACPGERVQNAMLKRFLIVSLVMSFCLAGEEGRAADSVELSTDNVTQVWRNINDVILVLSANIALEDEWVDELRNMQPTTTSDSMSDIASEMATFREKLNKVLASSELSPVEAPSDGAENGISGLYTVTGTLLDNLIFYLIKSDSLASVAIYYGGEEMSGTSNKDVMAQLNLANQRLEAFIVETGL